MYKLDYTVDDYLRVTDSCGDRLRALLNSRYAELEDVRDAINDRYPFEDLFLKCAEVDDEEFLIQKLLEYLDSCVLERKEFKKKSCKRTFSTDKGKYKQE